MNFSLLLQQLDNVSFKNQETYKDITGILFFNDEEFQSNANFLNDNDTAELYKIKTNHIVEQVTQVDLHKQLSQKVKIHIDLEKYNLSSRYYNLSEAILSVLKFQNHNAQSLFFKKLLKEFDTFKLYKKFNCKKHIKKSALRKFLIENNDNNENVRQFLADYLNINLVILTNKKLTIFCKDKTFEMYHPTIIIYEHEISFQTISDKITNNSIFLSEDHINMRLKKYFLNKAILRTEGKLKKKEKTVIESLKKEEPKKEKPVKMTEPNLINFNKLKVAELRNLCEQYHIIIRVPKASGKGTKYMLKKEMVEKLKIIIG